MAAGQTKSKRRARSTSPASVVAGTLVAFGTVAVVLAVAGAVGNQLGINLSGISGHEWRNLGFAGAAVATVVLFLAFVFGGYTAGRMGRRDGTRHGLAVFVLAAAVTAIVVGLTAWLGDTSSVRDRLTDNGVPTDSGTWGTVAVVALVAGVAAMLFGSLFGSMRGVRWHDSFDAVDETDAPSDTDHRGDHDWDRVVGRDATTIDLTAPERQPSVEEEREAQRQARADVGL